MGSRVFVWVHLRVWYRQRGSFRDRLECAALLLLVLSQVISQCVRLVPRVVLCVLEVLVAVLEVPVGVDEIYRLKAVLVVFSCAILRFLGVVGVLVEGGAISGEGRNFGMTWRIGLPHVGEGLVLCENKGCSIVGALEPCLFYVFPSSLPFARQVW